MTGLRLLISLSLISGSFLASAQLDASFRADTNDLQSFTIHFSSIYQLSDTASYDFLWDFGDNDSSELPFVSHTYSSPGSYLVTFRVSDGINSVSTSMPVAIANLVEVPNVFTPNGDDINDFLVLKTNGSTLYSLVIFNRSGVLVYKKDSYSFAWDGKTPSGADVHSGVYYYVLSTDGKFVKSGFFHLIR